MWQLQGSSTTRALHLHRATSALKQTFSNVYTFSGGSEVGAWKTCPVTAQHAIGCSYSTGQLPGAGEAASAKFALFTNVCCALNAIWIAVRKAHPHLYVQQ